MANTKKVQNRTVAPSNFATLRHADAVREDDKVLSQIEADSAKLSEKGCRTSEEIRDRLAAK